MTLIKFLYEWNLQMSKIEHLSEKMEIINYLKLFIQENSQSASNVFVKLIFKI